MTTTTKIKDDAKAMWLEALDSGRYKQCTGHLFDGSGYCCLGVLAKAAGGTFVENIETSEDDDQPIEVPTGDYAVQLDGRRFDQCELLDEALADHKFGLDYEQQQLLSHLNDGQDWLIRPDSPVYSLAMALCERDKANQMALPPPDSGMTGVRFMFRRHNFHEISEIIREHF